MSVMLLKQVMRLFLIRCVNMVIQVSSIRTLFVCSDFFLFDRCGTMGFRDIIKRVR